MAIRHYVDLDCPPRMELGGDGLLELLARRERADAVAEQFAAKYKLADETKMRFREKTVTPDGAQGARETTVAELRAECAPLDAMAHHCMNCPASLGGQPYSCIGAVGLPISAAAEQWLVDSLPPAGDRATELFVDACANHGWGQHPLLARWRKAGFMEAQEAARGNRGGLLVTSDQVLHELLLVGDIMPEHGLGVLAHLRAIVARGGTGVNEPMEAVMQVLETGLAEDAPDLEFALAPQDGDDQSILELKLMLSGVYRALSLQVPLAIKL